MSGRNIRLQTNKQRNFKTERAGQLHLLARTRRNEGIHFDVLEDMTTEGLNEFELHT